MYAGQGSSALDLSTEVEACGRIDGKGLQSTLHMLV